MATEMENQEVKVHESFVAIKDKSYVYECPECERPVSEEYMICFTCQVEDFR